MVNERASRKEGFYLWRCLPDGAIVKVGALAIEQLQNKRITNIQFKYASDYLLTKEISYSVSIPLDPIHAPLNNTRLDFETAGRELPGFIDDCLPDDWGRRIVALRLGLRHLDTLTLMCNLQGAAIGDIKISKAENKQPPVWQGGVDFHQLAKVADAVWHGDIQALSHNEMDIALLLQGGSRTGGARPKVLTRFEDKEYLAKFNRSQDSFNVAAVEWASMQLAKNAGLRVADTQLVKLGERDCLLVERFDISPANGRYHLLTMNALLKDSFTQDDPHNARYEDIADIIRRYSQDPQQDLQQLLGQLLINSVLNNTDDHLRNFSYIHKGTGWDLSPAYDVLPSEFKGSYHQLTLGGKPFLPEPRHAVEAGKLLGLGRADSQRIGKRVVEAFSDYRSLLTEAGLEKGELDKVCRLVNLSN